MGNYKALIFDVDGTLAETERDGHRVAFNRAFEAAGLDWDWTIDLYGELLEVTGGKERIQHFVAKHQPNGVPEGDLVAWAASLHKAKSGYYQTIMRSGQVPLRPGVEDLLAAARASGIRLAIATTTTPENVPALLEPTLGVESLSWFEVIAAGDIVPSKKPAPDIYEYVLKTMNLEAADCLAFEDSRQGLRSSIGAGLKTIVTYNDYTRDQDFTGAAQVISQLGEPMQYLSPNV